MKELRNFLFVFICFFLFSSSVQENTLSLSEPSMISKVVDTDKAITLTFSDAFTQDTYPTKIGLIKQPGNKVTVELECTKVEGNAKQLSMKIPKNTYAVGQYKIKLIYTVESNNQIFDNTYFYFYEDKTLLTEGNLETTIGANSIIDSIEITFNNEIFYGRFSISDGLTYYATNKTIVINTSKKVFSESSSITITDNAINSNQYTYNVIVNKDYSISLAAYTFYYKDSQPEIEITVTYPENTPFYKLYSKIGITRAELTKKDETKYVYKNTNSFEEVYFEYQIKSESPIIKYSKPIYIYNDVKSIVYFSFSECYKTNDPFSSGIKSLYETITDVSSLFKEEQYIINTDGTETKKETLNTAGTYKYKLFTKKDELLYEKQFIVTDISGYTDNISYCGSNPTSSFLLTAKCSLSLILKKDDVTLPLKCSSQGNDSILCNYQSGLVTLYGDYELYYKRVAEEIKIADSKISIYKALSLIEPSIVIPPYPIKGDNTITITGNEDYDLQNVIVYLTKSTDSTIVQCKDSDSICIATAGDPANNKITLTITLGQGDSYYISSLLDKTNSLQSKTFLTNQYQISIYSIKFNPHFGTIILRENFDSSHSLFFSIDSKDSNYEPTKVKSDECTNTPPICPDYHCECTLDCPNTLIFKYIDNDNIIGESIHDVLTYSFASPIKLIHSVQSTEDIIITLKSKKKNLKFNCLLGGVSKEAIENTESDIITYTITYPSNTKFSQGKSKPLIKQEFGLDEEHWVDEEHGVAGEHPFEEEFIFIPKYELIENNFLLYKDNSHDVYLFFKSDIVYVEDNTLIQIKNDDTLITSSTSCTQQLNKSILKCNFDLSSINAGKYNTISIVTGEISQDFKNVEVEIIDTPDIISSVSPLVFRDDSEDRVITLTYNPDEQNFNSLDSITLINVNDYNDQRKYDITKDANTIKFTQVNKNQYGKYYIVLNYKNDMIKKSAKTIIFIDKAIQFSSDSSINRFTGSSITNTVLKFDNTLYDIEQIKSVTYNSNSIPFIYKDIHSIIIEEYPPTVIETDNLKIEVTDIGGNVAEKTVSIFTPPTAEGSSFSKPYYLFNPNKSNEISIIFDTNVITEMIPIVINSDNELEFIFKESNCEANKECVLIFDTSTIPNNFYNENNVISFKYIDKDGGRTDLFTKSIYIINSSFMPTDVINKNIKIKSGESSFSIKLNQKYDEQYKDLSLISIKEGSNPITDFSKDEQNANEIIVTTSPITSDKTIIVSINSKEIEIQISILKCKSPQFENQINREWGCYSCANINPSKPYYNNDGELTENKYCIEECPYNKRVYNYQCLTDCNALSSINLLKEDDNKCVIKCSNGYGFMNSDTSTCVKCSKFNMKAVNGKCQPGCPIGSIETDEGNCVLPGDLNSNTSKDVCSNYICQNGGKCIVTSDNKPQCECVSPYMGMSCEFEKTTISAEIPKMVAEVYSTVEDMKTIESRIKLKNIYTVIEQSNYNVTIPETQHESIVAVTNDVLDSFITDDTNIDVDSSDYLLDVADLAMLVLTQTSKADSLKEIVNKTVTANEKISNETVFKEDESIIQISPLKTFSFQRWSSTQRSKSAYERNVANNNRAFVDFAPLLSRLYPAASHDAKYFFTTTDISPNITKIIDPQSTARRNLKVLDVEYSSSHYVYPEAYNTYEDGTKAKIDIPEGYEFLVGFPMIDGIDKEKYIYYKERGLDIYDPKDPAFLNDCYYNKELDYDLPQRYRRKELYQQQTFKGGDNCKYQGLDLGKQYVVMSCSKGDNIGYTLVDQSLELSQEEIDHQDNLPTKCGGSIDSVAKNIAFWLYLCLFIVFISLNVIFCVISKCFYFPSSFYQVIYNDKLDLNIFEPNNNSIELANIKEKEVDSKSMINPANIKVKVKETPKKTFGSVFIDNMKELHPLCNLCRPSIISPILFNLWLLMYNIIILFGFNALYFSEDMLIDRIESKDRDNFGYPMKTEFERIMSAIATAVALNLIIRAICLVTYQARDEISNRIQSTHDPEEKKNVLIDFSNSFIVRRIIAGIFMLGLSIFFWYYTIVFCGIYVNAQYGWFYSGIWALFWNWVAYGPFYILIISSIEMVEGMDKCAYYMKRFFVF